jgi:dienelactone hydrolase
VAGAPGKGGSGNAVGTGGSTEGRGGGGPAGSGPAGHGGPGGGTAGSAHGGSSGAAGSSGGSTGTAGSAAGSTGNGGSTGTAGSVAGSTGTVGRGGSVGAGGSAAGGRAGGAAGSVGAGGRAGSTGGGTCTASKSAGANASGSGPHKVTVETNSDTGIKEGTIFRPSDLGGAEKYPIFVWGEGGCSLNGLSNSVAMGEIASHGYFVIADGTPNGSGSRSMNSSDPASMGKPLLAYIAWAMAENDKPCSAYYQSLDTTKVASNGFSCGGLMAEGTAGDARITTWGLNSSGLLSANQAFYKTIHTPVLIVLGGSDDIAYENGERDYDNISALGIPIMLFSKALGHGGDLFSSRGGDFTKIDLAWLNWHLKGDESATGKGLLVGSGCSYCTNSAWEVKSKNIQ